MIELPVDVSASATGGAPGAVVLAPTVVTVQVPQVILTELFAAGPGRSTELTVAVTVVIDSRGTAEGRQSTTGVTTATVVVSDPDGSPGSGDESAAMTEDLAIPLEGTTWTATGSSIDFVEASLQLDLQAGAGAATLSCQPGTAIDDSTILSHPGAPFAGLPVIEPPSTAVAPATQEPTLRRIEQDGLPVELDPVELDGDIQVRAGRLRPITIENAAGHGAGFTVSAYATDLGSPAAPMAAFDLDGDTVPDIEVPSCTPSAERACIPSRNLGWEPAAEVVVNAPEVGTSEVTAGPASAADLAGWRAALTGGTDPPGLSQPAILCSSHGPSSAGGFRCTADLFLGIPASAAATTYRGFIIITIL